MAALSCGCQIPQDTDDSLERVKGGTMRVGVSESDPWVELEAGTSRPSGGAEVELIRHFARDLDARIEWVQGSEEELVDAMKAGSLDLMAAGLTKKSRWKKDVAFTRPYVATSTVVGVPPGSTPPGDLAGVPVAAELGSEAEGLLEAETEAAVRAVPDLGAVRGRPVAAHDYVLDDLGLTELTELKQDKHVMAVRLGENAFLVRLERFLLNREEEIERLLREEGRP
jgi:polar amino acid transport system substrate-binding protein